jgi:hypothetical protein
MNSTGTSDSTASRARTTTLTQTHGADRMRSADSRSARGMLVTAIGNHPVRAQMQPAAWERGHPARLAGAS